MDHKTWRHVALGCLLSITFLNPLLPQEVENSSAEAKSVLTQNARAGQSLILVEDASKIALKEAILIPGSGENVGEIYYVATFSGNQLTLTAPLQHSYGEGSLIIQGFDRLREALASGAKLIGSAEGVSAGAFAWERVIERPDKR